MPSTTNFGWTTPADTDYVKDGASAIRTLAGGIDTSMAQLKGGTTGQILSKTNGTDMAFTWINNDQGDITGVTAGTGLSGGGTSGSVTLSIDTATTVDKTTAQTLTNKTISATSNTLTGVINNTLTTTTGDLIYASSANTPARLGIGSSNQVLTVSGGVPTWATPSTSSSGMTLITRQTVTNAADTGSSFNNVFSSTYNSYCVIIETMASSLNNVLMQFKNSSGTYTSSYYGNSAYALYSASSFSFINTNNASAYTIMGAAAVNARATIWINGVGNSSARATYSGNAHEGNNNRFYVFGGELGVEDVWTGLLLKMASGNITVTASVYGLAKS